MHPRLLYTFLFTFSLFTTYGQATQPVRLVVTETGRQPLPGAAIRLVSRADSSHRTAVIADSAGRATVLLRSGEPYNLVVTAVGMKTLQRVLRAQAGLTTVSLTLDADTRTLGAVTVTARKPLIRQDDDKLIVDPTPIADISTNAYELMERTPGLFLDQDGNVYLSSATPATIYINGREQKMSATDIATLLKSLPPNSIERIELMRTPSAKYDASSSGGAVNIVLKKGVKLGRTGSLNASANQGKFGNQTAGISVTNAEGARTTYLNLNYNRRNGFEQLTTTRQLPGGRQIGQNAYTRYPGDALFAGYGLAYDLKSAWTLSLDGRGSFSHNNSFATNLTQIRQGDLASAASIVADNSNDLQNQRRNLTLSQDVSLSHKLDSLGSEWRFDGSYTYLSNDETQAFQTQFRLPTRYTLLGDGTIDTRRHSGQLQTDLRLKLNHGITAEAGLKSTFLQFDSRTRFFSDANGSQQADSFRTNTYDYQEAIHAAYAQVSKPLPGSWLLKVGLRAENTNMDGHQRIPRDTVFRVRRTDLFPYLYLSRPLMKIAKFGLTANIIYRRAITRPTYDNLNPFARFIDPYLYEAGNPSLRPQFTQTVEANVSVDDFPLLAVGQNHVRDIFSSVLYQDPRNPAVTYRTFDNVGRNRETYFRLMGGIPPGGRYFFVLAVQYTHTDYDGVYENQPLQFSRGSWRYFTMHQLKLDGRSTFTLNAFYLTRGQQQFYELGDFGNVNLSLNRQFMARKLTVTVNMADVFYTNRNTFGLTQGNIVANGARRADTQRLGLSLRYNFGLSRRDERNNLFNMDALDRASR